MVSTEIRSSVSDEGSMMDLAERDQHQARLKLGLLKTDLKIKPYVKACGRLKPTGTLAITTQEEAMFREGESRESEL